MKTPSPRILANIKKTAIEAALRAGAILKKNFERPLQIREKAGAGLVTQVDLAAEKAAIRVLKKSFPNFSFLAEESGASPHSDTAEGRWVIDPLDGTTNFVHGFPMFCVSIGAEVDGELVAGVIYHPILDDLYVGVKGQGATVNRKKLRVSKTRRLEDSLLTTGFAYSKNNILQDEIQAFTVLSAATRAVRRPGSAALDLAYTARGVFDGFWERKLSPWDVAAGVLILQEAGGTVTSFSGGPYQITDSTLLASNSLIHPDLVKAVSGHISQ